MKRRFVGLLLIALTILGSSAYAIPDCGKANKTKTEWMLCSSDKAAVADQLMAAAFRDAFNRVKDQAALLKEQEEWNRDVRDACNDVPCLVKAYRDRANALETY
jgi:uncharacterized protein